MNARIQYLDEGIYEEVEIEDTEARDLIDFLGFNQEALFVERRNAINRLRNTFQDANMSSEEQLEYFRKHPDQLSFITALETELDLNLSEFYT